MNPLLRDRGWKVVAILMLVLGCLAIVNSVLLAFSGDGGGGHNGWWLFPFGMGVGGVGGWWMYRIDEHHKHQGRGATNNS